jgi:hypothetical protein
MKLLRLTSKAHRMSLFIPLPGLIHGKFGSAGNETWTDMMAKGGTNCLLWVSTADIGIAITSPSPGVTLTESYLQPNYILS